MILFVLKLLPKKLITSFFHFLAQLVLPKWLIYPFLKSFVRLMNVNLQDSPFPLNHYSSFNQFFTRPLKPSSRPIDQNPQHIISPVDASIVQYGNILQNQIWKIKGIHFSIPQLLHSPQFQKLFLNGQFIVLYLSPKDYHRVHSPCQSSLVASEYHPGKLFPVKPSLLPFFPNLFALNERIVSLLESPSGIFALIKIAAINVGSIHTSYSLPWSKKNIQNSKKPLLTHHLPQPIFLKGQELARFSMGSTVIILFQNHQISFLPHIKTHLFLKLGQSFACFV